MGHSQADKAQTHQRLVRTAAGQFRDRGIEGISLAELMKLLGLTHGGFYKHFSSRDELVGEAIGYALAEGDAAMHGWLFKDGKADLPNFIHTYLSEAHRDSRANGCTVSALSADVARKGEDLQGLFRDQIERNIGMLVAAMEGVPAGERRGQAMLLLSALYGALMLARSTGDSRLSQEFLRTVGDKLVALGGAAPKKVRGASKAA
ncbi:TetR/AcrR family transcriptional regulator [Nevskia soli]|uniref:TetR/AcrR family transcriptional regulator n=1 Tax=Nevskia soli TaxID=418856 RepID=UPI0004A71CEE|nr:TetR/AcrR family transcriptional regulator [Nevskia soli]